MANTIPQHGTPQSSPSQQQAGVSPPQGQMGGLGYQATQGAHASQSSQGAQGSQSGLVDKITQSADETAHKAIERVQQTRERALSGVHKQQAQLGERIRDVSEVLRSSSHKLDDNQAVASILDAASEQVNKLASYIDAASPRSVASDVHNFARERPAWFFGGAFLAGLALGRFAKSSARTVASEGYRQQGSGTQQRALQGERDVYPTSGNYSANRPAGNAAQRTPASSSSTGGTGGSTPRSSSSSSNSPSTQPGGSQSGSAQTGNAQTGSTSGNPSGYATSSGNTLSGYGQSPSSAPERSTQSGIANNNGGSTPGAGKS